ncbi:hypothetical protein [Paenibacillus oceani]|uniref:Uncharacterized protein n=1 Tax=Paenibacillus oceani TaxID=2772510 RepID=A0A927GZB3_9BACL|nr:hypothetical protein [Paenibacillus oceani]MBD2862068.1 hypothetical protein [Paenibacillus oceani]
MAMFKWFAQRGKPAPDPRGSADHELARLERQIERLEQTVRLLANETRKQNIVVRQLNVHHPVVENVTFRLDALDIEELSGSLNLGNNFDVQFDPQSLFRGKEAGKQTPPQTPDSANTPDAPKKRAGRPGREDIPAGADGFRRTSSGYSYKAPQ